MILLFFSGSKSPEKAFSTGERVHPTATAISRRTEAAAMKPNVEELFGGVFTVVG